jgi:RimJ/RimL family protein N-acetyltransferase
MSVKLIPINLDVIDEQTALKTLFTTQIWPYHSRTHITDEQFQKWLDTGYFTNTNALSFWITQDDAKKEKIGYIRLFDLEDIGDGSPLFDLRLIDCFRHQGYGKLALSKLVEYIYSRWPYQLRIEGTTRVDNTAMRKAFESNLFVKEGHYRKTWPNAEGELMDTVHYALLRTDWENKSVTPVPWD